MGGGPDQRQISAANREAQIAQQQNAIAQQRNARENEIFGLVKPYYLSRMNNGLPFMNAMTDYEGGTNARSFIPERNQLLTKLNRQGNMLPSGFREGVMADFDARRAQGFDDRMKNLLLLNETAKNNAAQAMTGQQQLANPLGWFQGASQSNNSIMQAPLQSPGMGGMLGGIAGGVGAFL
jgi:hypothetical protein